MAIAYNQDQTIPYSDFNIGQVQWMYQVSRGEAVDIIRDYNHQKVQKHYSKACAVINPFHKQRSLPRNAATVTKIYY